MSSALCSASPDHRLNRSRSKSREFRLSSLVSRWTDCAPTEPFGDRRTPELSDGRSVAERRNLRAQPSLSNGTRRSVPQSPGNNRGIPIVKCQRLRSWRWGQSPANRSQPKHLLLRFFQGLLRPRTFAILVWLPVFRGELELASALTPRDWHVHEMLYGYLPAVITGFLLTAVPNWTGRLPRKQSGRRGHLHHPSEIHHGNAARDSSQGRSNPDSWHRPHLPAGVHCGQAIRGQRIVTITTGGTTNST
jgi:hypothetical protein